MWYLFSLCSGYLVHQPMFPSQNKVMASLSVALSVLKSAYCHFCEQYKV